MKQPVRNPLVVLCVVVVCISGSSFGVAQESSDDRPDPNLKARQQAIASRYESFENLLRQLAEYLRKTDPERTDLLLRAHNVSKDGRIRYAMDRVARLLEEEEFGDARERQAEVVASLKTMLTLLQSEDRRNELVDDIEHYESVLKDVRRVIGQQKVARATAERGRNTDRAEGQQQKVNQSTDGLLGRIEDHDRAKNGESKDDDESESSRQSKDSESAETPESEEKPSKDGMGPSDGEPNPGGRQSESGDSESGDQKSGESSEQESDRQQSGQQQDGQQQSGDQQSQQNSGQQSGQSQQQQSGQQQTSQQQTGQKQTGQKQSGDQKKQDQTPGREQLEAAREKMQDAIEELKKQNKDGATDKQDEALADLIEAKEKLEEILRQLREEERELMLAALEARFRKMLNAQIEVYNGTVNLAKTPQDDWPDRNFSRVRELGQLENMIALEAAKTVELLKEEGTSVAFPIAAEDLQDDMLAVVRLLEASDVGELTQQIETDIIDALNEMLDALQKEMEKKDNESEQQQQQQQSQNGEPPLVELIAELKMLRTLQQRINRRTKTIDKLGGEDADSPEVRQQFQQLSRRQERIEKTARDIDANQQQ